MEEQHQHRQAVPQGGLPLLCREEALDAAAAVTSATLPGRSLPCSHPVPVSSWLPAVPHAPEPSSPARPHAADAAAPSPHAHSAQAAAVTNRVLRLKAAHFLHLIIINALLLPQFYPILCL